MIQRNLQGSGKGQRSMDQGRTGQIGLSDEESDDNLNDLYMDSSDCDAPIIDFEQANQENFRCLNMLRPLFVIAYYMICCCLVPKNCFRGNQEGSENRNFIVN